MATGQGCGFRQNLRGKLPEPVGGLPVCGVRSAVHGPQSAALTDPARRTGPTGLRRARRPTRTTAHPTRVYDTPLSPARGQAKRPPRAGDKGAGGLPHAPPAQLPTRTTSHPTSVQPRSESKYQVPHTPTGAPINSINLPSPITSTRFPAARSSSALRTFPDTRPTVGVPRTK